MGDTSKPLRYVDVSFLGLSYIIVWVADKGKPSYNQIGINFSDPVFRGEYHGKQVHESDLDDIIQRAREVGCEKFMVTGSDVEESRRAIEIAQNYRM